MSSQIKDKACPVSRNLTVEMERTGQTIADVAQALGVGERQITRWRGGQEPRFRSVVHLARLFGRDDAWFYTDHSQESTLQ